MIHSRWIEASNNVLNQNRRAKMRLVMQDTFQILVLHITHLYLTNHHQIMVETLQSKSVHVYKITRHLHADNMLLAVSGWFAACILRSALC